MMMIIIIIIMIIIVNYPSYFDGFSCGTFIFTSQTVVWETLNLTVG
jgi:hypothetical protein